LSRIFAEQILLLTLNFPNCFQAQIVDSLLGLLVFFGWSNLQAAHSLCCCKDIDWMLAWRTMESLATPFNKKQFEYENV